MKQSESDIQKQIVEYLSILARQNNFIFFSIPNEGMMLTGMIGGMNRKILSIILNHLKKMGLVPGMPDIAILYSPGKIIFIEVKKPGEKPTTKQYLIHEKIRQLGHKVYVCVCVEGVERVLRLEGVTK